jgi:hypothetical protein
MSGPAPSQLLHLLDDVISETSRVGRPDLAARLAAQRGELTSGGWHVLVTGEFKKGKSALVNALLGVPVCGSDAVAFTAVPTVIRYGPTAAAYGVLDSGEQRAIEPAAAAGHALSGTLDGDALSAVIVELPRRLLQDGLILVDTPGLGGGFAAAAAAATMRALSLADAVLVVSDASQEYTASEVEFIRRAAEICPRLLCVLTKTDFYAQWQRIARIDRDHLHRAGLAADIVPVSAVLRSAALRDGDRDLNRESGFPALAGLLRAQLSEREGVRAEQAAAVVRSSLHQVARPLSVKHEVLTRPEAREDNLDRLDRAQERSHQLRDPGARWQHVLADGLVEAQSRFEDDLLNRIRRLEHEATQRIRAGDPERDWATLVPWLYQRTNEELTEGHRQLLARIDEVAAEIATLFDQEAAQLGRFTGDTRLPVAGAALRLEQLNSRGPSNLELGMHAARGWSLSSSVITTLLVTTLHPGLLVALPVTAALGALFAVKTVRGVKAARLEAARAEALRNVAGYLHQARTDANRAALSVLRSGRGQLRDYYLQIATELAATVQAERSAALDATRVDQHSARHRADRTAAELARVTTLLDRAERVAAVRPGAT